MGSRDLFDVWFGIFCICCFHSLLCCFLAQRQGLLLRILGGKKPTTIVRSHAHSTFQIKVEEMEVWSTFEYILFRFSLDLIKSLTLSYQHYAGAATKENTIFCDQIGSEVGYEPRTSD